jgi:hypothetical protein
MKPVRYVMATDWHDHWDKLPGGLAVYTTSMLVPPMATQLFEDGTTATFLLFSKSSRRPLKAWSGKEKEISHEPGMERIAFRVKLSREIRFPRKYARLPDGWYVEDPEAPAASSGFW